MLFLNLRWGFSYFLATALTRCYHADGTRSHRHSIIAQAQHR
ncbi:hypothetical protein CORMATOL_01237 [Corynebacterium matruchotii ATCC 33806]|uniref:Uncharacterized protein n=1 Tax=Corynebacterium matruchotii ATCC 33806 TaxID=566549 RepID=C0E2N2_9CORY|nr:hypothetical protein CORMATOL_01237 [Corynebacterium matruchotii ATCC 33806]